MKNLLKIVVVFLFVALVAIVIITGVQKMMTQDVHYDPGPQVPADYTDSPILDRDAELSDSSGFDAEATTTESDSDDEDLTGSPVSISTIFRCTDAQKEAEICTLE